ncbi:hypothetical protein J6590_004012 [Homalodisca vitripennis]|nr:hypothetical protein J6590_004012 [Homalodisca vitripennis]
MNKTKNAVRLAVRQTQCSSHLTVAADRGPVIELPSAQMVSYLDTVAAHLVPDCRPLPPSYTYRASLFSLL